MAESMTASISEAANLTKAIRNANPRMPRPPHSYPYPFIAYSTTRIPRMSWECPGNEQR